MTSRHLILYAEDDLDDLQFVKEAFEKHDHIELLHAPEGVTALELLNELASVEVYPCLVILDINMPRLDGKLTLEKIKKDERFQELPVVLFSTSSSPGDFQFAKKWNADMVPKPLNMESLEYIAKTFLEKCNFEVSKIKTINHSDH